MIRPDINLLKSVGTPNSRLFVTLASSGVSANHTTKLGVYQTEVYVDNNNSSYSEIIQLPAVSEARGLIYTIRCVDVGNGVEVHDQDDSQGDWSDQTFDADGEYLSVYSDGRMWHIIATDIT